MVTISHELLPQKRLIQNYENRFKIFVYSAYKWDDDPVGRTGNKSKNKSSSPLLDLHAYKADQVFPAVDKFLMKHQDQKSTRIMTGKGKGVVQKLVIDYLQKAGYPWSYEKIDKGKANTGVVVVHMN